MKNILFLALFFFAAQISTAADTRSADPLVSHIDASVKPGDDFFLYANGAWFKQHPIPASEQSNGLWQLIQDTINAQVRTICVSSAALASAPAGSNKKKIGDFYTTGMDSVALNAKGLSDLKDEFDRIDAIADLKGVVSEASHQHAVAGAPLFTFAVGQDDKISSKNAVFIYQGGLSLPDRNYYFDTDSRALTVREKFVSHLQRTFALMGYADSAAADAATRLMALETAIAKASRKREDTRDPLRNYNKMSFGQLTDSSPNIDWKTFIDGAGLKNVDTVIVGQPEFLASLNGSLKEFPLSDWKNYLKYHLVHSLARALDDKTYLEIFGFYSGTLRGVQEPKARWKRVVEQTDGMLGELIGQVYVNEYLPKGTKAKLLEIGNSIKAVYAERIKGLDWMSEGTKKKALRKLGTMIMKVGYPDKWKDVSTMKIDNASYVRNVMNASVWAYNNMIAKYGKPVDRTEWGMEPQTYNAYYNPSNNEICVPGSNIIVPGYERTLADDALLYSIIGGSTFGHEMTHGFDDQGSKYDENGNLNNWWTEADSVRFYAKTKMIVKQYDNYVAVDSLHVNGELTQGENIADLGGIMMGFEAFKKTKQYKNHVIIGGLSPEKRFFLGYALAWMINERPESIANQVKSNEHSPARQRVIGPLSNMPEFYAAFGIKQGDAMWRPDSTRVRIW
ncbi:MAG TPA: M13 family metallopeptidase [Bacteroidota bacterium]|nr:M13 family metallopeptidase [Bacteroidota bacterium]